MDLESITLGHGSHPDPDAGMCVMEAVAYVAGEPFSDHPACTSPVITAFCISWNDSLRSDADRDRLLKPLIPLLIGTRTNAADEETRAWMATDWLVRVQTPAWLRRAGLAEQADLLAALAPLDPRTCPTILPALQAVRGEAAAAWAAAGAAAGAAAWDAAGAAARAAARDAARDAAGAAARAAAGDAARAAAWDAAGAAAGAAARAAARAAAGDAARAAAGAALAPTVTELQASAADLITRMCQVGRVLADA